MHRAHRSTFGANVIAYKGVQAQNAGGRTSVAGQYSTHGVEYPSRIDGNIQSLRAYAGWRAVSALGGS